MPESKKSAETTETPVDLTGRTLGDFQVLRKIGQGGMGQVYLARQQSLKREVALKILRKDLADNPTALLRFQAEAEAVARISHPNIVQVYSIGEQDGLRYMALEYVEGRNLRDYLDRKGPPELPVALTILRQVAAALQRASELGLVHRDIKPENILLNRKAEVKVTDFGLSRYFGGDAKALSLTQSGMTLGTPLYMSPEQVQGKAVDHRSDLYSFGVTAYHVFSGFPPYKGMNAFEVAVQHVQGTPEPLEHIRPDLPTDLCNLVRKLMAKNPDDRYSNAKDVIRDLAKIQKGIALGLPPADFALTTAVPSSGPVSSSLPIPVNVALSGTAVQSVSLGNTGHISIITNPPPNRWPLRILGFFAATGVAVGGWYAFGRSHAAVDASSGTIAGLPDSRPPSPMVLPWEAEWKEKFKSKAGGPQQTLKTGMQLGLYYLKEHRFDDAEAVFNELENSRLPAFPNVPALPLVVGKFGKAIVLAWRDKPLESVKLFEDAVLKLPVPFYRKWIEPFFFENTEFSQAISEALNRDAENLAAMMPPQKLPTKLEWLRTPSGLMGGPR